MLLGGKVREHVQLYATPGLPRDVKSGPTLKERAAATMGAGYYAYRVDGSIQPNPGFDGVVRGGGPGPGRGAGAGAPGAGAGRGGGGRGGQVFDSRARIVAIAKAAEQIREGIGQEGNWAIDIHQKFDFHETVEICRLIEPFRPYFVEDPVREEQNRTQIPKLRLLTSVPLAPGEEWGQRWEFNTLVENRDIDFARATLPNVGGITEMMKIMAMCDTHKVGIVPHFTGPVGTAAHIHTMTAFPGQVVMEYNYGNVATSTCVGVRRFPRREVLAERSTGTRHHARHGATQSGGGIHRGGERQHLPPPRWLAVALVEQKIHEEAESPRRTPKCFLPGSSILS